MSNIRGLELLHTLIRDELSSKEDCLVAAIHCLFVNKLGLCVGLDDEWRSDVKGSELLPNGWNSNNGVYILRYISEDSKKYVAKIAKAGNDLILTALEIDKNVIAGVTFKINDYVTENLKEYCSLYQNLKAVSKKIDDVICILQGRTSSKPDATEDIKKNDRESSISNQGRNKNVSPFHIRNQFMPNVGRADLDPFGGGIASGIAGGMLYSPNFHQSYHQGLRRGSVPPGARFDPIEPGLGFPRHIGRPNPDHLPPPGYGDMFM